MMKMIKGLLDRIVFAVGVLLFMQVPHFIDQYEQRLGGYYQAQVKHLEQYQNIANQQHQGSLSALIREFESSVKPSVQQTAAHLRTLDEQAKALKKDVDVLANDSFVEKVSHMVVSVKVDIAHAVIQSYTPAFPLTLAALVCGLLGGVLLSLVLNACFNLPKLFRVKPKDTKKHAPSDIKRRVEPTIMRTSRAV